MGSSTFNAATFAWIGYQCNYGYSHLVNNKLIDIYIGAPIACGKENNVRGVLNEGGGYYKGIIVPTISTNNRFVVCI